MVFLVGFACLHGQSSCLACCGFYSPKCPSVRLISMGQPGWRVPYTQGPSGPGERTLGWQLYEGGLNVLLSFVGLSV